MSDTAFDAIAGPPDGAALRETIRHRVEAAGTSFYWAMRLLPQERRDGMYAIYAWCREVDDIADGERPAALKLAALAAWRDEIEALYGARPRQLVARALHAPMLQYRLRREDFLAVIDGMEMDVARGHPRPRSADSRSLLRTRRECCRPAFGKGVRDASRAAHRVAVLLGRALQLTNILRDLDEDARAGGSISRARFSTAMAFARGPRAVLRHPALPAVCRELAASPSAIFATPSTR